MLEIRAAANGTGQRALWSTAMSVVMRAKHQRPPDLGADTSPWLA